MTIKNSNELMKFLIGNKTWDPDEIAIGVTGKLLIEWINNSENWGAVVTKLTQHKPKLNEFQIGLLFAMAYQDYNLRIIPKHQQEADIGRYIG